MRKSILLSLLSLVLLPPASAGQSGFPAKSTESGLVTEHIKHSTCSVKASKDFSTYGLYFHIEYVDKPPYDLFVEGNTPDFDTLYDECQSFLETMEMAQIKEAVQNGKEEMKRLRENHFFLKVAKK
jgi:hypothetical protein